MKSENPALPKTVSPNPEEKTRKPYAAPAIDASATIEPVTLGTKPRGGPGGGC